MMGFKQVIDQFKQKHAQGVSLDVLPHLMNELVANGLDISKLDSSFYTELVKEIYGDKNKEALTYVVDAIFLLSQVIPVPTATPKPVAEQPKPKVIDKRVDAIIENDIVKTEHLVDSMPNEDDEGDPFYIAPEDMIPLRPEDFAPVEYDDAFCKLLGVDPRNRK